MRVETAECQTHDGRDAWNWGVLARRLCSETEPGGVEFRVNVEEKKKLERNDLYGGIECTLKIE